MEKGEMGENATGRLATYYVAECMEFNRYGEYREDIHSAEEAVKIYQSIPSERLNAGKGIGLHVEEEDGIPLEFSLVYNGELDVDLLVEVGELEQVLFSEKYILTEDDYQEFSGNLMEAFQELEKEYGPPPREKEQGYLFQALWYQAEELNPGEGDCFGD